MLKVIVDESQSKSIRVREGETKGRKWRMASQDVWIFAPGTSFPEKYNITLPDGALGYSAGEYQLDFEALLTRGQYDSLSVATRGGVLLLPVQASNQEPKNGLVDTTVTNTDTVAKPVFGDLNKRAASA